MATKEYCDLIDQICALAKIPNSRSMYETADLEVDEIKFTLIDASTAKENGLAFFCDFGLPPTDEQRALALQRLLELNLVMSGINTPVFTINRQSGHVLMMARVPIEKITAQELMNAFVTYAAQAKEWRKTYFLLGDERAHTGGGGSHQQVLQQRVRGNSATDEELNNSY